MAKAKSVYTCTECGGSSPKWQGQCPACNAWNTLVETLSDAAPRNRFSGKAVAAKLQVLSDVQVQEGRLMPTGIGEFDRVLGGGLVAGPVSRHRSQGVGAVGQKRRRPGGHRRRGLGRERGGNRRREGLAVHREGEALDTRAGIRRLSLDAHVAPNMGAGRRSLEAERGSQGVVDDQDLGGPGAEPLAPAAGREDLDSGGGVREKCDRRGEGAGRIGGDGHG